MDFFKGGTEGGEMQTIEQVRALIAAEEAKEDDANFEQLKFLREKLERMEGMEQ